MKRNRSLSTIIGIIACMCFTQAINGQEATTWIKTFRADDLGMSTPRDICQLPDSGYAIVGDIGLMKIDLHGDFVWLKQYDLGNGPVRLINMEPTYDDGYILSAYSFIDEEGCISLIKTDHAFDTLWTKTYYNVGKETYPYSLHQTNDGSYIMSGSFNPDRSFSMGFEYSYLARAGLIIKTDQSGEISWTKTDLSSITYIDILQNQDNSYIIAAEIRLTDLFKGSGHSGVRRFIIADSSGNFLGNRFYNYGDLNSMSKTEDGNYLLLGSTDLYNENPDVLLAKVTENGSPLWTKKYGGDDSENGHSVQQTNDGGYIILGEKDAPSSFNEIFLVKTDNIGNTTWTRTIRHDNSEVYSFRDILPTTDGGYLLAGTIGSSGLGELKLCLIKTDENGNVNEASGDKDASVNSIRIYPNPAHNSLTIEREKPDRYSFEITSLNGKLIQKGTCAGHSQQIDISSFQDGIYFITIRFQGHVFTKKFSKL